MEKTQLETRPGEVKFVGTDGFGLSDLTNLPIPQSRNAIYVDASSNLNPYVVVNHGSKKQVRNALKNVFISGPYSAKQTRGIVLRNLEEAISAYDPTMLVVSSLTSLSLKSGRLTPQGKKRAVRSFYRKLEGISRKHKLTTIIFDHDHAPDFCGQTRTQIREN